MILPNHDAEILHWSFYLIDKETKKTYLVDTYAKTRNKDSHKGYQKDDKTRAILKLLLYNNNETNRNAYKLVTVKTAEQGNNIDCGVLACYLAFIFSKTLDIKDIEGFKWNPEWSKEYRLALAIAILHNSFEPIDAMFEAKKSGRL